jgi:hypothetical protein
MFSRLVFQRRFRFALIGLLIGFVGLGIAVYRMSVEADTPTRPKTREISDVLSDTIKKTVDKLRAKPPVAPSKIASPVWPASKKLGLAASICGFIAAVFGCISWLAHEHRRWTYAALGIGVAALAWQHVVVAAALAVGIALFLIIISHAG